MPVGIARLALFLDVRYFAVGGQLAIAADHASAGKCREPEEPDKAHSRLLKSSHCKLHAFETAWGAGDTTGGPAQSIGRPLRILSQADDIANIDVDATGFRPSGDLD